MDIRTRAQHVTCLVFLDLPYYTFNDLGKACCAQERKRSIETDEAQLGEASSKVPHEIEAVGKYHSLTGQAFGKITVDTENHTSDQEY